MYSERIKNSLTLTYKALSDDGKQLSKSITISNLNKDLTDEKAFEVAQLVKALMEYANEKVIRKYEDLLVED